ncbi:hypothetical protein EDF22_1797 [Rathayibacter sp. PhB127]|uniref:hypothetical protein n=1 Tax=unclassified Rathayibacter TaxID=2609250 RepID=UPI000FB3EB3B|nr:MULTISPECIES: hypothetical protein [unclassified Rathayibacter]ROS30038.1 hypothetical protein EDF22_1797 [Rathayibacter sp. PhB127]TDX79123.1 hypothetical protein EDF35_2355 [Rathayibacter sp. PhB151]
MNTFFYAGIAALIEDATATAVMDYSSALARQGRVDTVTLLDHASPAEQAHVLVTLGAGVPLAVRSAADSSLATTSEDLRQRLDALRAPAVAPSDTDPRIIDDRDVDFSWPDIEPTVTSYSGD